MSEIPKYVALTKNSIISGYTDHPYIYITEIRPESMVPNVGTVICTSYANTPCSQNSLPGKSAYITKAIIQYDLVIETSLPTGQVVIIQFSTATCTICSSV